MSLPLTDLSKPSSWSMLFDKHPLPTMLVSSANQKIIATNAAAAILFKKSTTALTGQSFHDLVAQLDKGKVQKYLQKDRLTESWSDTLYLELSNEEVLITECYAHILQQEGEILHYITLVDCTNKYIQQEQLEVIAERYKDFMEQSVEGVFLHEFSIPIPLNLSDTEFVEKLEEYSYITDCNNAYARMLGYKDAEEVKGLKATVFVDFKDQTNIEFLKAFKRNNLLISDTESYEKDKLGNYRYFLNNLTGITENGFLKRVWGSQREITEKKEAEKKAYLLASLVEQTSDILIAMDKEFSPITWSKAAEKIYGLTSKQAIGKNIKQYLGIYYKDATKEEVRAIIHAKGKWRGEIFFQRPTDYKIVTLLASIKHLNNEVGHPLGYIFSSTDISPRIESEQKIRLLASLVENTSDLLIAVDLHFIIISWNTAAERLSGDPAEKAIGKVMHDFLNIHYRNTYYEEVKNILATNGVWRGEISFIRPSDEKKITLLATYKLFKDEKGTAVGFIISGTEITKRKEAELRLKESESRFREVADSAPVGIWMVDQEDKVCYVNKYLEDFTGYSTKELLGTSWALVMHPDESKKVLAEFDKHFHQRIPVRLIYQLRKNEGGFRWVQDTGMPRFLADGTFLGYIGSVIDIDNTKRKELQLRHQAIVLENVLDCIITMDLDFRIRSFNKTAEQWFGLTREQAIGKDCRTMLISNNLVGLNHEEVIPVFAERGMWEGEVAVVKDNKEVINYYDRLTYLLDEEGNRSGILFVSRDITDRKIAEAMVAQSEMFYRSLTTNSLDGMLLIDTLGTINFVFPSIYNILGYESEDMLGKNTFDFVHPDDLDYAKASFQEKIIQESSGSDDLREKPISDIQFVVIRVRKKNGEWLWCMVRGHSQLHNPHINSIVIYFHNDTLRKSAIDALKESEQRFRRLIHDLQVGVILQDGDGRIIMANQLILENLGVSEEQLKGKFILDIIASAVTEDGESIALSDRPLMKAMETRQPIRGVVIGVVTSMSKERKWAMLDINPIFNDAGEVVHIITSLIDITERKKLETKLRYEEASHQRQLTQATIDGQEKERREIGKELHDNIGQQLTTTKLYLDLAKSTADSSTQEMVSLALKSVMDVINEIRGISRALMPPTLGDLGLIESIRDLMESITRTQTLRIELDDLEFIEEFVPENQKLMLFRIIQEQLNNIVKHAKAKMVFIVLQNVKGSMTLTITDDGKGFDVSKARKGLGLTNIRNRAALFGGETEIISAEGEGCTIKVIVPGAMQELSQFQ